MLRLGAHESIAGGLYRALERAAEVGCECVQIWTKNSRQWRSPPLTAQEITQFKDVREQTGLHAPIDCAGDHPVQRRSGADRTPASSCPCGLPDQHRFAEALSMAAVR